MTWSAVQWVEPAPVAITSTPPEAFVPSGSSRPAASYHGPTRSRWSGGAVTRGPPGEAAVAPHPAVSSPATATASRTRPPPLNRRCSMAVMMLLAAGDGGPCASLGGWRDSDRPPTRTNGPC